MTGTNSTRQMTFFSVDPDPDADNVRCASLSLRLAACSALEPRFAACSALILRRMLRSLERPSYCSAYPPPIY